MVLTGVNVIAIGDSNTYGFGEAAVVSNGAWRYYFGTSASPYFKGRPNWVGNDPALGSASAGNKMLGAIGQRVDQILTTYDAANQFIYRRPDVGIFLIGVNDCNQIYTGTWVGGSISLSISNMSTLLDAFRTASPQGMAIVSKLPPSTTSGVNDQIVLWNAALDTMIAARSDVNYIFVADLYTAFTNNASWATDYMWNFLHYNSAGQALISATFVSILASNVSIMPRSTSGPRRVIRPHTSSLLYSGSTATILGTGTTLDTTKTWAVSFDINFTRVTGNHGILCLKTDQATPFVFLANFNNTRLFEMGSSANFNRIFPPSTTAGDVRVIAAGGWCQFTATFDGVDRTAASSYKLYVNGNNISLISGSGLSSSTNQNAIDVVGALSNGTFYMANLTIWNGGSVMTPQQAADWYFKSVFPTGPTLIRNYPHTDGSGSVLTDTTGNQNGAIGTATWDASSIPTKIRTVASARLNASTRNQAT